MFYLFEILGVFLQNTIIFGGFRASSWGILKISSGNTGYSFTKLITSAEAARSTSSTSIKQIIFCHRLHHASGKKYQVGKIRCENRCF
jgi:hypothetical protein